ncbi:hypothetical protein PBCVCVM1_114R [Paramecium bursaria Chlorella virus CVM-1]|nr:hypothetical protein PBCVCVM1_114R [Paramecium bursaria Chlorella virus CVM-1]
MLHTDELEIISRSLGNVDVVNLSMANRDMFTMMRPIVDKKRVDQFAINLENALRLVHNAKIFANREIADKLNECEVYWPPNALMDNILQKMSSYLQPTFSVEDMMYDDADPNLMMRACIDEFVVDVWIKAGIGGALYKPMYNWNGVTIDRIDIYQKRGSVLMSWSKKHEEQMTKISYSYGDKKFHTREYKHPIFDTFTRFDKIEMTPVMGKVKLYEDYIALIAEQNRNIKERDAMQNANDDVDDCSDDDSLYDDIDPEDAAWLPNDIYQHLRPVDDVVINKNDNYHSYTKVMKHVVDMVFFKPQNIVEDMIYKADDVISKFLFRYQTWSTSQSTGYIHAREVPEWFDKNYDIFVADLKEYSKKKFSSWQFIEPQFDLIDDDEDDDDEDDDDEDDDDEDMNLAPLWKFTTCVNKQKITIIFWISSGMLSWGVDIDGERVHIHALDKTYWSSRLVTVNGVVNFNFDKQFSILEDIGFSRIEQHEINTKTKHFTNEEKELIYRY